MRREPPSSEPSPTGPSVEADRNPRLKLHHLVTLVSIGRHRNAHRAAQEMGVSQPSISKTIREIEAMFGAALFDRGRGGMHPNRVGEALIARAAALLNEIDNTRDEISTIAAGHTGEVRVGAIAFMTPSLISRTLQRLQREGVSLAIEVREGTTRPLVEQLLGKELDCVIGRYSPEHESRLDQRLLYYQSFAVVVSRRHPTLGRAPRIGLADTLASGWIVTPPRTAARQALSALFLQAGLPPPRVQIETASMEIIKATLIECNLVGLLPAGIADEYAGLGELRVLPFEIDDQPAPLMLIRRRGETELPSVERFCRTLIATADALSNEGR